MPKLVENKFGKDELWDINEIEGKVFIDCTACMSVWAEALSWANIAYYHERLTTKPQTANAIIVVSCQVTDLAILNDLREIERLMVEHPNKTYYIGGCLAMRFDISLPANVYRVGPIRKDYTNLNLKNLVPFAKPFWVPTFKEEEGEFKNGHLFRDMYPLRISVGCKGSCTYCTIKTTRGDCYELNPMLQKQEFMSHSNVVLIADSPSAELIKKWCTISLYTQKELSIRNIEPAVALVCQEDLTLLARNKLLKIFHCPIQSVEEEILRDMHRPVEATLKYIKEMVPNIRSYGVKVATNIIIDYKGLPDNTAEFCKTHFDYTSWNPFWDGVWDRKKAEERFKFYFG